MMEPDVKHSREGIQLSFGLPYRLNATCVYPRKPLNGSTVIICAHSEGLRIVWYAGKKKRAQPQSRRNENSIDLTDEDNNKDTAQYEDEEEEVDPTKPFHSVLTYTDIPLGTAATKVAVPPVSSEHNDDFPHILSTHIVVIVACADLSLRIIAISIEPASARSDHLQQVIIQGSNSHQDLISDVAITITATPREEGNKGQGGARSRSGGRDSGEHRSSAVSREWSFLLASTSTTGTGLLLIHKIPIERDRYFSDVADHETPIQRKFLRTSLTGCHIEFNQSLYPSDRHANLLIAPSDGTATKIYQAIPQTSISKRRTGSGATVDSTTSGSQQSKKNTSKERVLINLLTPFSDCDGDQKVPTRRQVLDAKWILHGRAVLVLLDDGEWGIWDVEAAGHSTSTSVGSLVKGSNNTLGIQGGSVTKFAIKGKVNGSGHNSKQSASKDLTSAADSSLAPMTPHTRKKRSQGLFKGQESSSPTVGAQLKKLHHGHLAVLVQSGSSANSRTQDESVIFSFGSDSVFIPSIQSYWRSENNGGGSFDGSASAKPIVLPQLQKSDEDQLSIHLLPQSSESGTNGVFATTKLVQSFAIATVSRLILFVPPLTDPATRSQTPSLPMRLATESSVTQDQMLLDSGELDIDGMDRILSNMANRETLPVVRPTIPLNGFGRKSVGFQLEDEQGDMDMDTPTVIKSSRSMLAVNKGSTRPDAARRLFT